MASRIVLLPFISLALLYVSVKGMHFQTINYSAGDKHNICVCIYRDRWLAIVFKFLSGSPQGPPPPPPPPPNGPDGPPPPPPPPGMTAAHRTNHKNIDQKKSTAILGHIHCYLNFLTVQEVVPAVTLLTRTDTDFAEKITRTDQYAM